MGGEGRDKENKDEEAARGAGEGGSGWRGPEWAEGSETLTTLHQTGSHATQETPDFCTIVCVVAAAATTSYVCADAATVAMPHFFISFILLKERSRLRSFGQSSRFSMVPMPTLWRSIAMASFKLGVPAPLIFRSESIKRQGTGKERSITDVDGRHVVLGKIEKMGVSDEEYVRWMMVDTHPPSRALGPREGEEFWMRSV